MPSPTDPQVLQVLLIEDNPDHAALVRANLSRTLEPLAVGRSKFDVTLAGRLDRAIAILREETHDVALLDLKLPDCSGLETLYQLRGASPRVPVVVLGGDDDDGLALQAIRGGAQDYVCKDRLAHESLGRTIRHAVERHRVELELHRRVREVEDGRRRLERQSGELRRRAEQLDRVNRYLDDFTCIASHDLKEPLHGIRAYCELLLEEYSHRLEPSGKRRLGAMTQMCGQLSESIDSLLTFCRVGRESRPGAVVDLNAVVQETLRTLAPAIERRGGVVRVANRLPRVQGDANLLGMVFGNLISNGLKFNESPRPWVEIGRQDGGLAGQPVQIHVRDNGIGIARSHHEAIFTIFRRLHSRRQYEGSGAGLTIVRKIIELHGGRIELESEPGNGSTFRFTLGGAVERTGQPPHWNMPPRETSAGGSQLGWEHEYLS